MSCKKTPWVLAAILFVVASLGASLAFAEGVVLGGQFATAVEKGQPVGDATGLATATKAVYFIKLDNPGKKDLALTIVWSVDGKARRPIKIHTPGKSTWVFQPINATTKELSIQVQDEQGTTLHTDTAKIRD